MANTSSAKKAHRVSIRKNKVNTRVKNSYKDARNVVKKLLDAGKIDEAKEALNNAYKQIDFAVKKGMLKKNTGARYKSRLGLAVNKTVASK